MSGRRVGVLHCTSPQGGCLCHGADAASRGGTRCSKTNYIRPLNVICRAWSGRGVADSPLFHGPTSRWRPALTSSSGCPGVSRAPKDKGWQAMKGLLHSFTAPVSTNVMSVGMDPAGMGGDGHGAPNVVGLLLQHQEGCGYGVSDGAQQVLKVYGISARRTAFRKVSSDPERLVS